MASFLILDLTDFSAASMVAVTLTSGRRKGVPGALRYNGKELEDSVSNSKTSLALIADSSEHAGE